MPRPPVSRKNDMARPAGMVVVGANILRNTSRPVASAFAASGDMKRSAVAGGAVAAWRGVRENIAYLSNTQGKALRQCQKGKKIGSIARMIRGLLPMVALFAASRREEPGRKESGFSAVGRGRRRGRRLRRMGRWRAGTDYSARPSSSSSVATRRSVSSRTSMPLPICAMPITQSASVARRLEGGS